MKTENRLLLGITTVIVAVVAVISIFGMILHKDSPELLQGEIECTQIKISGKLLGRIEKFHVQEGDAVKAGDQRTHAKRLRHEGCCILPAEED